MVAIKPMNNTPLRGDRPFAVAHAKGQIECDATCGDGQRSLHDPVSSRQLSPHRHPVDLHTVFIEQGSTLYPFPATVGQHSTHPPHREPPELRTYGANQFENRAVSDSS